MRRRYLDRIETASAIVLAVLALIACIVLVSCLDWDLPQDVKPIYSGRVFQGGPWRVIYEQGGRQYSVIAPDRETAEAACGKE